MSDYTDLVKALRCCIDDNSPCFDCPRFNKCMADRNVSSLFSDAADAVEELILFKDQVEKGMGLLDKADELLKAVKPRWIPVSERLIHSGWYLVACNEWGGSTVRKAVYDEATKKWLWLAHGGLKDITKFVTHYMPLPEPPKEETE